MKLEVGMYCYDKCNRKAGIGKIAEIREHQNYIIKYKNNTKIVSCGNIIASHDIIDLIEIGDYVNGDKISYIDDLTGAMRQFKYDYEDKKECGHWEEEIETILTKEQFENNCYKTGD